MPASEVNNLPLWGIPFAVKDNIDVEGFETTAACRDFAEGEASSSAPAVQALLDAGEFLDFHDTLPYTLCLSVLHASTISRTSHHRIRAQGLKIKGS